MHKQKNLILILTDQQRADTIHTLGAPWMQTPHLDRLVLNDALKTADLREKLLAQGDEPVGGSPDALAAYVQSELNKWRPVAKAANVTAQ